MGNFILKCRHCWEEIDTIDVMRTIISDVKDEGHNEFSVHGSVEVQCPECWEYTLVEYKNTTSILNTMKVGDFSR